MEGVSLNPFAFSAFLDLQSFLYFPSLPHFQHFLIPFLGDLDLPLDLDPPRSFIFVSLLGATSHKQGIHAMIIHGFLPHLF